MSKQVVRFGCAVVVAAVASVVTMSAAQYGGAPAAPRAGQQPNVPTPRTADGHPDLSGVWGGGGGGSTEVGVGAGGGGGVVVCCAGSSSGRWVVPAAASPATTPVFLALLLVGSMFAQALSYASVLGVQILAAPDQKELVAGFITGLFIARIPLLLFQAVQAALLPKLSGFAAEGKHDDFRTGLKQLLLIVVGIAVVDMRQIRAEAVIGDGVALGGIGGFGHGHAQYSKTRCRGNLVAADGLSEALLPLPGRLDQFEDTGWADGSLIDPHIVIF